MGIDIRYPGMANDLIRDMTLAANRARQDAITSELLDIIAGSMTFQ